MKYLSKIVTAAAVLGVCLLLCAGADAEAQNFADWKPAGSSAGAAAGTTGTTGAAAGTAGTTGAATGTTGAAAGTAGAEDRVPEATVSQTDLKDATTVDEVLKMVAPVGADMLEKTGGQYTLGPVDVIEITVMRHPEVSGEYPINNEGMIQYEFVGDLMISGLTKDQAAQVIREALSEYIVSPEVSVKIIQYNSKVVYIVGEVFRPGKIFMHGDTITVREALMQAGLPRLSGITKKSHLIRPSETGRPDKKYLNVYALLYEGDLRYNEVMEPGDMLYIPPTFLTKIMRAISPVAAPIGQAAGARVGVDTLGNTNER